MVSFGVKLPKNYESGKKALVGKYFKFDADHTAFCQISFGAISLNFGHFYCFCDNFEPVNIVIFSFLLMPQRLIQLLKYFDLRKNFISLKERSFPKTKCHTLT